MADIRATVQVGKAGLTEEVLREIKAQLEKRGRVKIRFLRSATDERSDMKETARKMAEAVGAKIADVRGFTVTLEKISR